MDFNEAREDGLAVALAGPYRPLRARTHQIHFGRNGENRKTKFMWRLKISQMTDWDNKTIIVLTNHFWLQWRTYFCIRVIGHLHSCN